MWFWFVLSFVRFAFCGSGRVNFLLVRFRLGARARRCLALFRVAVPVVQILTEFVRNLTRNGRVAVPVGKVQSTFAVELQAEI